MNTKGHCPYSSKPSKNIFPAFNVICLNGAHYNELFHYYKKNIMFNGEKYFIVSNIKITHICLVVHNMSHLNDYNYSIGRIQFTIVNYNDFNLLNNKQSRLKLSNIIISNKDLSNTKELQALASGSPYCIYNKNNLRDIIGILENEWIK